MNLVKIALYVLLRLNHSQYAYAVLSVYVYFARRLLRSDRAVVKALCSSIQSCGFDSVVLRCEEQSHIEHDEYRTHWH